MRRDVKIYDADKIRSTGWIGEIPLGDAHERYPMTLDAPVEQSVFTIPAIVVGETHDYRATRLPGPGADEAAVP